MLEGQPPKPVKDNLFPKTKSFGKVFRKLATASLLAMGPVSAPNIETPGVRLSRAKIEMETTGITSEQRSAYVPGVTEIIYKTITPYGYEGHRELLHDLKKNIKEPHKRTEQMASLPREDAWRLYLGLPQQNRTFAISDYKPSKSQEDNFYYKMPEFWGHYIYFVMKRTKTEKIEDAIKVLAEVASEKDIDKAESIAGFEARHDREFWGMNVMGRFNLSTGKDERGSYISYYDKWDLDAKIESNKIIGKPFEIYDRLYFDEVTFKPKEDIPLLEWNFSDNSLRRIFIQRK
ncbi:MAG: hypothetical protein WD963_00425 [Candidatus Paceibacterota bacterium]